MVFLFVEERDDFLVDMVLLFVEERDDFLVG